MQRQRRRRARWPWLALPAAAALLFLLFWRLSVPVTGPEPPFRPAPRHRPVIDAGHGGLDGGSVMESGVREADLNLRVAVKTDLLMRFMGVPTVMLRRKDIALNDASAAGSIREIKRSDLINRVKRTEAVPDALLISIHQNYFTESQYFGLQTFYGKAHGSRALAEIIQESATQRLDTANTRQSQPVNGDIYLMANVRCPAVLVECGFLSHPGEAKKLQSDDYQTKLAALLTAAFLNWENDGASDGGPAEGDQIQ
ncbi:MAG: N-acetylmuramoyl-L-alanine amidase [Oscillospiraceae bacterium]|nr:N-acetylmuramoyl-L-alanine amidase [Oscillospiraceae bacterium]